MYASGLDVAAKDRLFERKNGILLKKKSLVSKKPVT